MNKNGPEKKTPNFYIPLPNFTKRQEKWFYFFSSIVIVLLIGLIGGLMYVTANPNAVKPNEKPKVTEGEYTSSKKEYPTSSAKTYSGGIYVPTEAAETTSPNTTAWYGEEIKAEMPKETTTYVVTTTQQHTTMPTTESRTETTTSEPLTIPTSEVPPTEDASEVQEESATGNESVG